MRGSGTEPEPSSESGPCNRSARRPIAVDLFSGVGGFSLGCEKAGFDVLAAVEYDPVHCAAHTYNFPATEMLCADASGISGDQVRSAAHQGWRRHRRDGEWDGQIDLLIGGPPCQGFSLGGKRAPEDPRNELLFSFLRLVLELRPRYFVMENVPGLMSFTSVPPRGGLLIDELVSQFRSNGYQLLDPAVLNASEFGVPQERRRLFLIGADSTERLPTLPSPVTVSRGLRPPKASADHVSQEAVLPHSASVGEAIFDLPDVDRFDELLGSDDVRLTSTVRKRVLTQASQYVRTLNGLERSNDDFGYSRNWDPNLLTSSARTTHSERVAARFAATLEGKAEPISRFLRLHRDGVSCTIRAGTHYERGSFNAPRPIHPLLPRVISVREAARLHSFPDWFRLNWTKWHGFRQVGNALPPTLAMHVCRTVAEAMDYTPAPPAASMDLGDPDLLRLVTVAAGRHFSADPESMPRNALRRRAAAS